MQVGSPSYNYQSAEEKRMMEGEYMKNLADVDALDAQYEEANVEADMANKLGVRSVIAPQVSDQRSLFYQNLSPFLTNKEIDAFYGVLSIKQVSMINDKFNLFDAPRKILPTYQDFVTLWNNNMGNDRIVLTAESGTQTETTGKEKVIVPRKPNPQEKQESNPQEGGRVTHTTTVEREHRFVATNPLFIPMCRKKVVQKRMIYGSGISADTTPHRYVEFGKFVLHRPSLLDGFINLKYKSGGVIPEIRKQQLSTELQKLFLDTLESKSINASLYSKLSKRDQVFFKQVVSKAGIARTLGMGVDDDNDFDDDDMKRFELLKNEYVAGNNAPQVMKELRQYVIKFLRDGRIDKPTALDLLEDFDDIV